MNHELPQPEAIEAYVQNQIRIPRLGEGVDHTRIDTAAVRRGNLRERQLRPIGRRNPHRVQ